MRIRETEKEYCYKVQGAFDILWKKRLAYE